MNMAIGRGECGISYANCGICFGKDFDDSTISQYIYIKVVIVVVHDHVNDDDSNHHAIPKQDVMYKKVERKLVC